MINFIIAFAFASKFLQLQFQIRKKNSNLKAYCNGQFVESFTLILNMNLGFHTSKLGRSLNV